MRRYTERHASRAAHGHRSVLAVLMLRTRLGLLLTRPLFGLTGLMRRLLAVLHALLVVLAALLLATLLLAAALTTLLLLTIELNGAPALLILVVPIVLGMVRHCWLLSTMLNATRASSRGEA